MTAPAIDPEAHRARLHYLGHQDAVRPAMTPRETLTFQARLRGFVDRLVGGTFKKTPLCGRPGETGCVISWVSFRENNVPPTGAIFGIAPQPGMTVACVNPARPGSDANATYAGPWTLTTTATVTDGAEPVTITSAQRSASVTWTRFEPSGLLSPGRVPGVGAE